MRISACYIVRNDRATIERSIESIRESVEELIVVDTGAVDGTRELAENLGARLVDFPWIDDFAAARNVALAEATGDYIVFIDADEYFSAETRQNLRQVIGKNKDAEAIGIYWVNIDQETGENLGEYFALRIFKNRRDLRFVGRIHEQLVRSDGKPLAMAFAAPSELLLFHTGYSHSLSAGKAERNYRLLRRELEEEGQPERLYMYLAEACVGLGRSDEAKKWALMDIDSGRKPVAYASRSYRILIKLMDEAGDDYEDRKALLVRAVADFPEVAEFWAELAELQAALFDYASASLSLQRALTEAGKPMGLEPVHFGEREAEIAKERLLLWQKITDRAKNIRVSACLIFRDDKKDIGRWLKGAKAYADEIVCVDTGSADGSDAICAAVGVTPYRFPWNNDFAAARNFALAKATGDYIVFLDADEYFQKPEWVRLFLAEASVRGVSADGFMLPLVNIDEDNDGREIQRFQAVRIFRNDESIKYVGRIHEQISRKIGTLSLRTDSRLKIYHVGYSSDRIRRKLERDLAMLEDEIAEKGEQPQFYRYLAECHFGLGHFAEALHYAELAVEEKVAMPGSESDGYWVAAQAMQEMDRPIPERLAFIRRAEVRFPKLPDFFAADGMLSYETGRKDEAYEPLRRAVANYELKTDTFEASRFPNMADRACYYLAELTRERGDEAEAMRLAGSALSFNRFYKKALNLYADLKAPGTTAAKIALLAEIYGAGEATFLRGWAEERADWELFDYYAAILKKRGERDALDPLHALRREGKLLELYRGMIPAAALNMQRLTALLLRTEREFPQKRTFVAEKKKLLPKALQRIMEASVGKGEILPADVGLYLSVLPYVIRLADEETLSGFLQIASTFSDDLIVKVAKILQNYSLWAEALALYQQIAADSAVVTADFWHEVGLCLYNLKEAEGARAAFLRARAEGCGAKDIEAYLTWIDEGYCHG